MTDIFSLKFVPDENQHWCQHLNPLTVHFCVAKLTCDLAGIILGVGSANESKRYYVTPPLIDRTHTENDPWSDISWYAIHHHGKCGDDMYIVVTSLGKGTRITMRLENIMMTSSNGNIFRVTGPLCGEFTGPGEFPTQRPVKRSFDVFFDLHLNTRLSKQPWGWWFETLSWLLWRHCNVASCISDTMNVWLLDGFGNVTTYEYKWMLLWNNAQLRLYWCSCWGNINISMVKIFSCSYQTSICLYFTCVAISTHKIVSTFHALLDNDIQVVARLLSIISESRLILFHIQSDMRKVIDK